ncbi:MAG TPA: peptidoglycan-binding domain-containing protein [Blastocatellia bacterium]|nr:peptidoglycan-binding domain-containing protein [Blastocatellia bacterium]
MKFLPLAISLLIPIFAAAQTNDWRVTEKEVKAVQAELTIQGYYKSKLTGVLDRDTRVAVLAYQSDNGLAVTGRIDQETYRKLGLTYPATGREADRLRSDDPASKVGYEVKDATVNTGDAVSGSAKKAGAGVRGGLEKTWDTGAGAVSKSKEVARGAGGATIRGIKSAGRAGARIFKRGDSDLQAQVRRLLESNPETSYWRFEVKKGTVTIKTPPNHQADIGAVVSDIRQIPGVESVFVVAL